MLKKNRYKVTFIASCFALVGHLDAANASETERTFMVANYQPHIYEALKNEAGVFPRRSMTTENGNVIWSAFDSKHPEVKELLNYSNDAFLISESRLINVVEDCAKLESIGFEHDSPQCSSEFLSLLEVLND